MASKEFLADLYRQMYTIRVFETRCIKLYRQGKIRGYFHPYLGEEAIAVGACAALRKQDFIVSTHRGHGHCIARGASIKRMIAELLSKDSGYCKGRGGSMHIADLDTGNLGANGIVGAGVPIGVGAGLGSSIRGEDQVTVIFCSDGAANNGVFPEAMNLAAIWNLPVILMLENNHYAVSTPIEQVARNPDLYVRSAGYGIEACKVDGNDVMAVYEKTKEGVELCKSGKGPMVIEAKTYRHAGHHVNDPGAYMPEDKLKEWKARDPLIIGRKHFLDHGTTDEIKAIEEAADREIESAIKFADESPEPGVKEFLKAIEIYEG